METYSSNITVGDVKGDVGISCDVGVNKDNRSDCVVVLNELCGGVEDSPVAIAPGISDLVQPGFLY